MRLLAALMLAAAAPAAAAPVESFVEAPGPVGTLKGTMLAAGPDAPVVLIIPGSGPTDRDGNNARGIAGSIYRQLADSLAARGISSVRIDKRGMFASGDAVRDPDAVTLSDYATDVRSWTATIRQNTGVPCVWLLGHSEGGLVALIAAKKGGDFCGLVLLETAGRPLGQTLRDEFKANPAMAPVLKQAMAALATLEAGKPVDTTNMSPVLLPLFRPEVQKFVIDVLAYDPGALLSGYPRPVLILQGDRDLQLAPEDARRLQKSDPKARLVTLPGVNHVLKQVASADRAANVATYANPAVPIAPSVVEAIAGFVEAAKGP
jgi:pimeloyl-ACP methyl ester carboxylesterase